MNVVVAIKDYTELDRVVRPLAAAGHQVTPVHKPASLVRTLGAVRADAVILEWGFGDGSDEWLIKTVRGPGPDGPRVLMLIPDRWPAEASHLFAWGAHDFVRRPLHVQEIALRLEHHTGLMASPGGGEVHGAPGEWRHVAFWRDLEDIVTAELSATIGTTLTWGASDPVTPLLAYGVSRLLLTAEGLEVIVAVGVDSIGDTPLAAALMGAPSSPEIMGDIVTELTNVAAGAIQRAALTAHKSFAMGLPALHHEPVGALPFERRWRAHGEHGIALHCMASARSSKPEVVSCGNLREGMVVNANVLGPSGVLLAAQGTCLTERAVARLRSMLGDRYTIEVTLPAFAV